MWANKFCFQCKLLMQNSKIVKSTTFSNVSKVFSSMSKSNLRVREKYNIYAFQPFKFGKIISNINCAIRKQATLPIQIVASAKKKRIGIWMACCTGMVYMTVFIGGYTRLTESGLSMVSWKFAFEKFPQSEEDWISEFNKYKEYPEYKLLKNDFTLEDFKKIFVTEYVHRNWGRAVGLLFLIPALSYWIKGHFLPKMKKRVLLFGLLIAAQGLLGWYMVKSGLEDKFHKETDIPRVSQYRLASHLGLALTLYTGFLWTTLDLLTSSKVTVFHHLQAKNLKILAYICKGMIFLTALSGALVAGLDAGLVYNSFPKMADKWIPDDIFALSPLYINFTENPTTVQFDHRVLGISTFSLIMATWLMSKKYSLPYKSRIAARCLALAGVLQVILGISTLVHYVPKPLALSHQSGSVILLSTAIWFTHELRKLKFVPKI